MKIVLFEDEKFTQLLPLAYFRPVWDLRLGNDSVRKFIETQFPETPLQFYAREYLNQNYLPPDERFFLDSEDDVLFVNGRWLPDETKGKSWLLNLPPGKALVVDSEIFAFRSSKKPLTSYFEKGVLQTERVLNDWSTEPIQAHLLHYPWDFIYRNGEQIIREFNRNIREGRVEGRLDSGVHLLNPVAIYLAPESRVMPGVVLNAENGPIWIDRGAHVMPNAVLEGPLYIGPRSLIKAGAKIYENTSIGPVCKVGGEVEETIIQGYSNKQHDGFLGHAFLGSWVNLGADTNNSDLKNHYGEITVFLNGYPVKTGKQFLGLIMGDHSKSAINTMFNTGTVVGVSCNVYGEGFPPSFIPSFSWGGSGRLREYNFNKALQVAEIVMGRRQVTFDERMKNLFKAVRNLAWEIENRVRVR